MTVSLKMRRDPFYWQAFEHYKDEQAMVRAGFFDDGLKEGLLDTLSDPRWLTTPLYKVSRPKGKSVRPLVLFSTGGFAPVHEGHVQMMEAARAKMTREGYDVIGGFLSPAHDSYVSTKSNGADRFSIHVRLENLKKALMASDWLEADPWMAMYTPNDLNFTDVYRRLEKYLAAHIVSEKPVEVAYVFGADNALFARAFLKQGLCVCVGRPGYAASFDAILGDDALMATGRIHLAESNVDLSSSQIRTGERVFEQLMDAGKLLSDGASEEAHTIFLRNDLDWALEPWRTSAPADVFEAAKNDFISGLLAVLQDAYGRSTEILQVPAREQLQWLERSMAGKQFINMDCVTGAIGHPAHISRLFHLSDRQHFSLGIVDRPDATAALSTLPAGDYALVDDDIATGGSMRALEERLPKHVHIVERVSLLKKWFIEHKRGQTYNPLNILDMRDFVVGARMGGLVVEGFDGSHGRIPYLAPYVSLNSRSSVPKEREKDVSARIFELNARFFAALGDKLTLNDACPSFKNIMLAAGFDVGMRLSEFCDWHRQMLAASL
jgi:nicotinic acid mononucleotide adenylyltransferase